MSLSFPQYLPSWHVPGITEKKIPVFTGFVSTFISLINILEGGILLELVYLESSFQFEKNSCNR
jgi:hypothetical protein